MSVLDAALALAAAGVPVYPVWSVTGGQCDCGRSDCQHPGKHPLGRVGFAPHGVKSATTDQEVIRSWFARVDGLNVAAATGHVLLKGGYLAVLDVDPRHGGAETLAALEARNGEVSRSVSVMTGGDGLHVYLTAPEPLRSREIGPGVELKGDGGSVTIAGSLHASGRRYEWRDGYNPELLQLMAPPAAPEWLVEMARQPTHPAPSAVGSAIPSGGRNVTLTSYAGALRRAGGDESVIGHALRAINAAVCDPPLAEAEVRSIARSVSRYPAATETGRLWPTLRDDALYGLAGDVVAAILPHSEADPAALLVQFLVGFGNVAGRKSYARVEDDEHPPGLYVALVGETAKGRKGTSWGRIRKLLHLTDPEWLKNCVTSGAVSGEGLVWEVRDATLKATPEGDDAEPIVDDPGVLDKRRVWLAAEFAAILKACARDGNTLSAALREMWDTGTHRTAAKNSPARTTGAHTSLICHVVAGELRRLLTQTDATNGFANRFLYVCARRSKILPEPTQPDEALMASLAERIAAAAAFAHEGREMRRDDDARALWASEYERLSEGQPGLLGAITNRAEAQVTRLSIVYALLDRSPVVRVEHLRAALAVWDYCADSAAWIFGDALGDALADRLGDLLQRNPGGLSRTEVRKHIGNHVPAERIDEALGTLADHGRAYAARESSGGRPSDRWYPTRGANGDNGRVE